MAAPTEFTLESVREFMLEKGGKVTNHELVKHFKQFLTDPYTKGKKSVDGRLYANLLLVPLDRDAVLRFLGVTPNNFRFLCRFAVTFTPKEEMISSSKDP